MRFAPIWTSEELTRWYPVIVEGWAHVVPPESRSGSKYRTYCAEFTEAERHRLAEWYPRWYHWQMVVGIPQEVQMSLPDYHLMKRAANFFGTL